MLEIENILQKKINKNILDNILDRLYKDNHTVKFKKVINNLNCIKHLFYESNLNQYHEIIFKDLDIIFYYKSTYLDNIFDIKHSIGSIYDDNEYLFNGHNIYYNFIK